MTKPSDRIVKGQETIEATSRIYSFNVTSSPGVPISPIEIRLTKDRLSLVSRVLSSNNEAYKHTKVTLDRKLGFKGGSAVEVKTLGMMSDVALQNEDFDRAYKIDKQIINFDRFKGRWCGYQTGDERSLLGGVLPTWKATRL